MKQKIAYECQQCGAKSQKWAGKCSVCSAWNSLVEIQVDAKSTIHRSSKNAESKIIALGDVSSEIDYRIMTGIDELDRVLGGGIIPGSFVLVGGDPGIGKSTLMLQMCANIIKYKPLYITGEESLKQIKYRSSRFENIPDELLLMSETNIDNILHVISSSECNVIVVDSIQSVYSEHIDATPGSMGQVRECASLLMQKAKITNKPIFIIGHVTKDGVIAGPKILEHTVDTVLQFEGEKTYSFRILRALKNRFGSTNEIGIFEMAETGLKEVKNPSEVFLARRDDSATGTAVVASIEGSRPLLLEVQALVAPSGYSVPQRTSNGFDNRRLQMILAVLEKRIGVQFRQNDIFVNVAGGVYLNDPSVDLGIASAIVSSFRDLPIRKKMVIIGEIGLTGEVRSISNIEQRISEAEKLGFEHVILPKLSFNKILKKIKINLIPVDRIALALTEIFEN